MISYCMEQEGKGKGSRNRCLKRLNLSNGKIV